MDQGDIAKLSQYNNQTESDKQRIRDQIKALEDGITSKNAHINTLQGSNADTLKLRASLLAKVQEDEKKVAQLKQQL